MHTVVFDACILYPAPLRDLLMQLALSDTFSVKWTERILDEWRISLLANRPDLQPERLQRTCQQMNAHAIDALVEDYEHLIETVLLPDPNDRHVLAAAIHAGASLIVTMNLKDFPPGVLEPLHIRALTPDAFISMLIESAPKVVLQSARIVRSGLRRPPKSAEEYLDTLENQRLPQTVAFLREHQSEL